MKAVIKYMFIPLMLISVMACNSTARSSSAEPPSHKLWDELVKRHVDAEGLVDYKGFVKDKKQLEEYLSQVSSHAPDKAKWSKAEQLAYWINAYNAFTIKLIVDNYPVESIQDLHPTLKIPGINTVWHKKFFKIGGKESSLDEIEHDILRKEFNEPRIHFAINCASYSCPQLRNEAYTAPKIEQQLKEQAISFVNDGKRNKIEKNHVELSKIFSWFTKDFTKKGDLIDFLNQYSKVKISKDADIDYLDYDWRLNEQE
ncbi:DUF547 domain-containing protein [Fulvivirga ligni]|uniref:DUF547 domain-containing protein n=1 Tax=Fulvivirga ligni TaxID=2904246 RepID=UPI00351EE256